MLRNPNSANSITCEDPPCGHTRCSNCNEVSGHGVGYGDDGEVGIYGSPGLSPTYLGQDKMENAAGDASLVPESPSAQSSQSSSSTEHQAALSSSYNTKSVTEVRTDATTVSNAAMFASSRHPRTNYSDNESVGSRVAQIYSGVSTVLIINLAQDLKDVDLAQSEDMLTAQLEGFSLRFGNESSDENHLRIMSIVYRHARYEELLSRNDAMNRGVIQLLFCVESNN